MCILRIIGLLRLDRLAWYPSVLECLLIIPPHPAQNACTRPVSKQYSCGFSQYIGITSSAQQACRGSSHLLLDKGMGNRDVAMGCPGCNKQVSISLVPD